MNSRVPSPAPPLASWVAAAAVCAIPLDPGIAEACSPPRCYPASVIPEAGAVVPANLPALLFTPVRDAATGPARTEGFGLVTSDGRAVPVELRETAPYSGSYLAVTQAPLEPGSTYRVRFPQGCTAGPSGLVEHAFQTGPSVSLPTTIGSASMTGHRVTGLQVWTSSGSCYTDIRAALAHVTVRPSPELRAYLPVARLSVFVNGEPAPTLNYQVAPDGSTVELDLYAGCVVADQWAARGLDPGRYRAEIRAHVVGQTVDPPPIWTDVRLECLSSGWPGNTATSDGGCSLSHDDRPSAIGWLLGVLIALWAARRISSAKRRTTYAVRHTR